MVMTVVTDVKSDQKTEDQLWTEFTVLDARKQACWQLVKQAWCAHVRANHTSRQDVTWRVWSKVIGLHHMWRDKSDAAYLAWKKVAYPMYGWPESTYIDD